MKTILGVDFDNTLISYDDVFYNKAVAWGLIAPEETKGKKNIRDKIRQLCDGEESWQRLQAYAYGPAIHDARLMEGAGSFLKVCKEGEIGVSLDYKKDDKNRVVIAVSDSGMGIPKDLLPHLFQQFARGSGAAKKIQGTGLGLYIAKEIMTAHKGDITAESAGEGKGSVFRVEIPTIVG